MRFGAAGAAPAARQRRRSGRRPLKPPSGRFQRPAADACGLQGGTAPMQNRKDGRCGGAPIQVIYPRKYNPERSRYGKPEN